MGVEIWSDVVRELAALVRRLDAAQTLGALPPGSLKELEYVFDLAPRFLWVVGRGSVNPAPYVYAVEVHGPDACFRRAREPSTSPMTDPPQGFSAIAAPA